VELLRIAAAGYNVHSKGAGTLDPDNPVVRLCAEGMMSEGRGDKDQAHLLFRQAWETATSDFERCIAAHYVARHQSDTHSELEWNRKSVQLAESCPVEEVRGFLPSLYLNTAHSYELLGNIDEAVRLYERARASTRSLPDDGYGNMIRNGIVNGLRRIAESRKTGS